jgi:AcrR family transcriptional regulator
VRHQRPPASGARGAARAERLERILSAAEELFASHGFAATTVDDIAAEAGVSKGLLYDHYHSKEELLRAVWDRLVAAWSQSAKQVKLSEGGIADAIGDAVIVSLRYVETNRLLRRIIAQDPGALFPAGRDDANAFGRAYRERLEPLLARGVRTGELRRGLDVERTAEVIWLLHFALTRELFVGPGPERLRADWEELVRGAVELIVAGLRATGGRH